MVAGSLTYDTKMDTKGIKKGLNEITSSAKGAGSTIKNIVVGLGITKLITTAMNTITGSLDKAISRYDTLNNFPKVMKNLGISTEESRKAVKKLSDGLQGIPTTLDDASLAVQRFTSANNDVNKSTDYFLAFNNALLAGGASAETQASALEQLSQAYAKGKPDAMEWRSIMTAMPAQLKQVAQAMGYTSTAVGGDFYNAIQSGKISMDDFMQTFVKLNTEGIGEYASFAEQARGATDGIQTSITNAKTAVVKGVTSMIENINKGLQEANLPNISEIINTVGKTFQKILEDVGKELPKIIEKVVEFTNWLIENKDTLITLGEVILVVVATLKAYELALIAVKAVNFVSSIVSLISTFVSLIPYITSAKDAMLLLNMAFGLNPVALIIAGIVALIGVFILLWNKCEWFRNFWIGLWEGIKNIFTIVWNGIGTFFTKTIPDWINSVIDWFKNLPYNIGHIIGELLGHIIKFGIDAFNWVVNELPNIINNIIDWFAKLPSRIWDLLLLVSLKIAIWLIELYQKCQAGFSNLINNIINWFKKLPENMMNIGKNIVEGIWNGIKNATQWIKDKLKEFAKGILDGIKGALGIHSPSTVMRDMVGKFIPQGIAVGIEANTKSIDKAVDKMNNAMLNKMQSAVNMETGKISANATVRSNANYNSMIYLNASFDGDVTMDNTKVGRIIAPSVARTIKAGGLA